MNIVKLCLDMGASKAQEIATDQLVFSPELRKLCDNNACGRFGRNYTCPPLIGEAETLAARLKTYPSAVIWQNICALEDSFDIEGMTEGHSKHNGQTRRIAEIVFKAFGREDCLVLAAGGCDLCAECACLTREPCRSPGDALSSLEAYGINVSKIEEVSGLKYINGKDTVTFFSGVFFRPLTNRI
jgi:predicted metal-binding protein